ncbi:hypothetical protein KZZ52_47365 [Dactylosporangium sp. AC04546]|uniref:DUF7691 family protein n=1 Tax=Dactylosporangium sp. AC04546 TaxID=2862460 RepID=UPI001EDFA502|nr:hypothetical protein [Dactylosporangium sp. AC04546]WVK81534.1 hypothetical protein KZZ52_47365 [Dactylosporangium sp. AC04546]
MAEQYLSAFAVDADRFRGMPGSGDEALVRAAVAAVGAPDLLRATDPVEVEAALREVVAGRLDPARPGGYTWLLELLGATAGTPVGGLVLPGRGWHALHKAMRSWGLPTLAGAWKRPFPWPAELDDPWPFPMLVPDTVREELASFDPEEIYDDDRWEDDAEELVDLLGKSLPAWLTAAHTRGHALLVVRDGGR